MFAKTDLSFAFVTDPTHEMYVYALRKIVKSDKIDVELVTLAIPALIQGFLGKQYDIVETSMISIPRAVERGLNVNLLFTAIGRLGQADVGHLGQERQPAQIGARAKAARSPCSGWARPR